MSFPVHLLRPTDTALCLFVAAFGGVQDVAFLRDAGVKKALAIDIDAQKVHAMRPLYPLEWTFLVADVYSWLQDRLNRNDCTYDLVTSDPWSGDADHIMRYFLPELIALTRRVLIYGVGNAALAPAIERMRSCGVEPTVITRTDLASWLVVEFPEV